MQTVDESEEVYQHGFQVCQPRLHATLANFSVGLSCGMWIAT